MFSPRYLLKNNFPQKESSHLEHSEWEGSFCNTFYGLTNHAGRSMSYRVMFFAAGSFIVLIVKPRMLRYEILIDSFSEITGK